MEVTPVSPLPPRLGWTVAATRLCALAAFAIGVIGLAGWVLDNPTLKRVHPTLVTMKANTAVCLMLAACSLFLQASRRIPSWAIWIARGCAGAVVLVGALTLLEHLTHLDLGIDQLLFHESVAEAGLSFPGRMGIAACLNFIFLGLGLMMLDREVRGRYCASCLALAASFVVLLTFLYYFYGVQEFSVIAMHATIALHTVFAFSFLSAGVLLARPERGLMRHVLGPKLGSVVARRMLPVLLLIIALGWLRNYWRDTGLVGPGFATAAFVLVMLLLFGGLIAWTASAINRGEAVRVRSEQGLREAQRIAHVGSWEWTASTDETAASDELYRLFGLTPGTEFPRFAAQRGVLYPGTEWDRIHEARQHSLSTGQGHELDVQAFRGNESIWVTARSEAVRDEAGKVVGLRGTVQDITGRKHAAQELDRTTTLLDTLLTRAPIGFAYFDRDLRYVIINDWLAEINGLTPAEHIGKHVSEVVPSLADAVKEVTNRIVATGRPVKDQEFSGDILTDPGVIRFWNESWYPVYDKDGKISGFGAVIMEITERKRAEAALRDREAILSAVTNETHIGLVMVDREHRYLFANNAYAEILGLPDANIVGKRVREVVAHLYDQISPRLERALAGERLMVEVHLAAHPRTGDEHFYEAVYQARRDMANKPYVLVVLVDITARKKAQQILERTVADRTSALRDTVAHLETFSYSITHDMRGPLRAMSSFAQLLEMEHGDQLDEQGREYLRRIRDAARRLDHLIQDVLQYSRLSKEELPLERVDVHSLLQDVIEQYPQISEHRSNIRIDVRCKDTHVLANYAALTQVLSNLLSNAVKFVPASRTPEISITCEDRGNVLRLTVSDNGIGIAPQFHQVIFGVFQRLHGREYAGTGIGLSIVKKAVERMGGRLGLHSEGNGGSQFWVELPRHS